VPCVRLRTLLFGVCFVVYKVSGVCVFYFFVFVAVKVTVRVKVSAVMGFPE